MSINIKALREEYAQLHSDATKTVDAATARGTFTAEDKSVNETRFARMEQIKAQLEQATKLAADSFPDYVPDEPRGKATANYGRDEFSPRLLSPADSFSKAVGATDNGLRFGDMLRAMVIGPRNDVERFALQRSSDSAGGFQVPSAVAAPLIDAARSESVFVRAGAKTVPLLDYRNRVIVPSDNGSPTFRAESASVTEESLSGAAFSLKTIAITLRVPRELLEDAIGASETLESHLAIAFGSELDKAIGWGASGGPTSISSTSNILSVASAANGDTISDYAKLLEAQYQLALYGTTASAAVMSPREFKSFAALEDTTGQPLRRPDAIATLPLLSSPEVPINQTQGTATNASTILMGDFSRVWLGIRSGLTVEVLKEKFAGTLEYGFRASLRMDSLVTRPKAICKVTGIIA